MSSENPYQTPAADLSQSLKGETDRSNVFSPQGRFGRLSYLAWGTLLYLLLMALTAIFMSADLAGNAGERPGIAQILVSIPAAIIGILFGIRRLHDMDASGWWVLLSLIPLINIGLALVLLLKAGTLGINRFGPPRPTPSWERVVGIVGIFLIVLTFVAMIAAVVIPMMVAGQTGT